MAFSDNSKNVSIPIPHQYHVQKDIASYLTEEVSEFFCNKLSIFCILYVLQSDSGEKIENGVIGLALR